MWNFFYFLKKSGTFLLFLLLFSIAFGLLVNERARAGGQWKKFSLESSSYVLKKTEMLKHFLWLGRENRQLQDENARLYRRLYNRPGSVRPVYGMRMIPARIVNRRYRSGFDYVIIDKGSTQGVRPENGVFGPAGVVGVVSAVSPHFSKVITLYNPDFSVDVELPRQGIVGFTRADRHRFPLIRIEALPFETSIAPGDTLVTGGNAYVFPPGIPVARVVSVRSDSLRKQKTIMAMPLADLHKTMHVYVARHPYQRELDSLSHEE